MSSGTGNRGEPRVEEPTRAQRQTARRAAESRATIPDLELTTEIDVRRTVASADPASRSRLAILVDAVAHALRDVPRANGGYRDGHFELYPRVNVGVVFATGETQVLATVFDADAKSLAELTAETVALGRRAEIGELAPPELSGSTVSLLDLTGTAVAAARPLITPSHVAALTAGALRSIPIADGERIVPGTVMTATLGCDARMLTVADAARFLNALRTRLESA